MFYPLSGYLCLVSALPDLMTCNISVEDQSGNIVRSIQGNVSDCQFEKSVYANIQPTKTLTFGVFATFDNKTDHSDPLHNYINKEASHSGIVRGLARVFVERIDGTYVLNTFNILK